MASPSPSSKYDSFRDSALHFLCNAGWGAESDGDANDYGSHFTRISLILADVNYRNTEFNSLIEQWEHWSELSPMQQETMRLNLTGHWIVAEGSQGFVHVREFPSEAAAKERFDQFAEHYASWDE